MGVSLSKFFVRNNAVESIQSNEFENDIDINNSKIENESIISTDRKLTDTLFLFLLALALIILFALNIYCLVNGDIYRIINGYDDCGNICGKSNTKVDRIDCSGLDRTNENFLLVINDSPSGGFSRSCVRNCEQQSGYRKFFNRCLPLNDNRSTLNLEQGKANFFSKTGIANFFQEVSEDLEFCWREILYLCFIAFCISILIIIALKYVSGILVWLILIGIDFALFCGTIYLWVEYSSITYQNENNIDNIEAKTSTSRKNTFLAFAIVITIIFIMITLVIIFLRKRIQLVVQLFKEAGKAIINMPLIIFIPIITFIILGLSIYIDILFAIIIESSGTLELVNNRSAKYIKDGTILFTRWFNFLMMLWMINFIIGCQHMIVSGAVAIWFFTRNKSVSYQPISRAFKNLIYYHLGTVALGSFLIAIFSFIRYVIKFVTTSLKEPKNNFLEIISKGCQCCLKMFEQFLKYITRNAYIETAITGNNFCESGQRAFSILSNNAIRVFAINSIGDFVLFLSKLLVVTITILIGISVIQKKSGVFHAWVILALIGIFSYCIASCFISLYEMIIDTIFICFCEDFEHNDGINKPFFMPRSLMEFVQNTKKSQAMK